MKAVMENGGRKHRGESEWRRLVAEQERSGLSQRAYCEREGLCLQSLGNWRRRLGRAGGGSSAAVALGRQHESAPAFVEIDTALSRPLDAGMRLRLELGDGIVLELSRT